MTQEKRNRTAQMEFDEERAFAVYGMRLRIARHVAGLKLEDIQDAIGQHKANVHRWEVGAQRFNAYQLAMWCQFVEAGPTWVLNGTVGPDSSPNMQAALRKYLKEQPLSGLPTLPKR